MKAFFHIGLFFMALAGIGLCLFFTGCSSLPLALPQAPGIGVISVTHMPDGFVLTQAKRDHLVSEGVPATWFTSYPDGHFWIDSEHEGYAADILLKERNP